MKKDSYKQKLTKEQYHICFEGGTEPPFKNKYWNHKEKGFYECICCKNKLFSSEDKYNSNTGWPSFIRPIEKDAVYEKKDKSLNMERTEVLCKKCKAHLGHVFPDGPAPTYLRYCINSTALNFKKNT